VLDRPAAAAANPFLGSYPDRPPPVGRALPPSPSICSVKFRDSEI
jgi:hypothetical protein